MTSYRSLSLVLYKRSKEKYNISPAALIFWTGTSILFEKAGKRDGDTKRRIYDSHDVLRGSFYLSHHGGRSFTGVQDDAFPQIVILNEDKNALWEKRKAERWHGVKNLWHWWHCAVSFLFITKLLLPFSPSRIIDPSHSFRMTSYINRHLHN